MEAAGLEARLQFGEVLWWFFPNASGMAFYDAYTTDAFQTTHGHPLHQFLTPNDDPSVNGHVDADFLRQTVRDHVNAIRAHVLASHPNAKFETQTTEAVPEVAAPDLADVENIVK
jgi:hypothetical protein